MWGVGVCGVCEGVWSVWGCVECVCEDVWCGMCGVCEGVWYESVWSVWVGVCGVCEGVWCGCVECVRVWSVDSVSVCVCVHLCVYLRVANCSFAH